MADITFRITNRSEGQVIGELSWQNKLLRSAAISGPHGNGALPEGLYHVVHSGLLVKTPEERNGAYCDSLRQCWFQYMEPQFSTERTELGIHPDGNVEGTSGCIGILDANSKPWYDAFETNTRTLTVEVV